MTLFDDGLAKGKGLTLRRSPVFLRVTEKDGEFDALDQLDDQPAPGETIHVYLRVGEPGFCFVDGTDKQGRRTGYRCAFAHYRLYDPQPIREEAWDTSLWREWCAEQGKRMNQPDTATGEPGSTPPK